MPRTVISLSVVCPWTVASCPAVPCARVPPSSSCPASHPSRPPAPCSVRPSARRARPSRPRCLGRGEPLLVQRVAHFAGPMGPSYAVAERRVHLPRRLELGAAVLSPRVVILARQHSRHSAVFAATAAAAAALVCGGDALPGRAAHGGARELAAPISTGFAPAAKPAQSHICVQMQKKAMPTIILKSYPYVSNSLSPWG